MANKFTQYNIGENDRNLLLGAAGRNDNGDMDAVLDQNRYNGLTALERVEIKNYASTQAQGMFLCIIFA